MREQLEHWIGQQVDAAVSIAHLARIGVGHSRAMWRVELDTGSTFVVRVEQGGVFGTSGEEEYRVMLRLAGLGFPVAPVRWAESTGEVIGRPFFVMDHLDGAAADEAVDRETAADFVSVLSRLHSLDGGGLDFDVIPAAPGDATHLQIDRWAGIYRAASPPIPLLEEAASWLHRHAPPLDRCSVVHGDAGPGNFIHVRGRVVALTDWEFAHLGDPAEDWVYCLTMRGPGTLSRDEWLDLYRSVAGVELTAVQLEYWEAFNLFKGACANRTCLDLFERGLNRAPNMAIIGTTLHQVFLRRLADLVTPSFP